MAINVSKINWTSVETHVIATIAAVVTLVTAYSPALGSKATTVASSVDVLIPVVFGLIALGVEIVYAVRKGNVSKVLADVTSAAPQVAAAVTDASGMGKPLHLAWNSVVRLPYSMSQVTP